MGDVEADAVEVLGTTHDVFVIVALPDRAGAMEYAIGGRGGERFECAKYQPKRGRAGYGLRRGAACCARGRKRPEEQNPVDVIWHYNKSVELDRRKPHGKFKPHRTHSVASAITLHFEIDNLPENGFVAYDAEGEEIVP